MLISHFANIIVNFRYTRLTYVLKNIPNEANFSDKNLHNMKLQSTSSGEGRNFPNFARVNANNAISKAIRNPLILDAVFANLDLPDLKTSRLVCYDWADVASTLLGKCAYLHVNKLFSYKPSKFDEVPPVSDKLMRRLLISDKFDRSIRSKKKKSEVITKAITELPKLFELIREIKLVTPKKEFVFVFLRGMISLGTTKVQRVDILSAWKGDKVYTIPAYGKLSPQPNLTSLRFHVVCEFRFIGITGYEEFQPVIQIWTDSAPNLTTLDIAAPLYPNLEGCKSLKVLKLRCLTRFMHCPPSLSLGKLTDMLGQVKDSLIELELYVRASTLEMEPVKGGPVMSKLTTLSIHATNSYRILNFFGEDHFPKLKTLRVHSCYGDLSFFSFLNLWRRHRGVKSLSLTLDFIESGEEFGGQVVNLFPAVKEFRLNMNMKNVQLNSNLTINRIFEPFQTLDLERVNILVDGLNQSTVVINVLKAMSALKGIKSVRFLNTNIVESEFSPRIHGLILLSRGFKRVEISGHEDPEILERMRPIFEASGAPINFTGGVFIGYFGITESKRGRVLWEIPFVRPANR
ncbi:uncharacterized protein LOC110855752 isoform X2 [Folsomia candida]|uniref:uncharacterized protein LOC110855752 isoform X2 n=2 Tax=Folsomia candida TaxID=158441 RepID=UPI001605511D|nr:uncharacterized protein LOC110855752 isoform X2 [Folsomia candida]